MLRAFLVGACGYPLLELLWRGRTHYSMAVAGGMGGVLLRRISRMKRPLMLRAMLGGAGITLIELVCGAVWNRQHQVWDYRRMPLNWRGQVCLPFSLAWCGMSAVSLVLLDKLHGAD